MNSILQNPLRTCFKLRIPLWTAAQNLQSENKMITEKLHSSWEKETVKNPNLIQLPKTLVPCFKLRWRECAISNRFHTNQGKYVAAKIKWNIKNLENCKCCAEKQTTNRTHIIKKCD